MSWRLKLLRIFGLRRALASKTAGGAEFAREERILSLAIYASELNAGAGKPARKMGSFSALQLRLRRKRDTTRRGVQARNRKSVVRLQGSQGGPKKRFISPAC